MFEIWKIKDDEQIGTGVTPCPRIERLEFGDFLRQEICSAPVIFSLYCPLMTPSPRQQLVTLVNPSSLFFSLGFLGSCFVFPSQILRQI